MISLVHIAPLLLATNIQSFSFTPKETETIKRLMSEKKLPWQVLKRLEAIRLLSKGISAQLVAKQLCVRREIVYQYKKVFLEGRVTALLRMEKPGQESQLTEEMFQNLDHYRSSQKKRLNNKDLALWLFEQYKVQISPEWLSKRLSMRKHAKSSEPWK